MIKDGQIAYERSEALLSSFERQSPIIYAFVLAIFSTVLSYQVSTVLTDLLLGLKRKGEARLSDIGSLLLAQEGSGVEVIRNIVRTEVASRLYVKSPVKGLDQQFHSKIRACVFGKLLLLLAVAPVVNLAAIAVTIERNQIYSFKEAGFGGMALGMNGDMSYLSVSKHIGRCFEHPLKLAHQDEQLARIIMCDETQVVAHPSSTILLNSSQARDLKVEIKRTEPGVVSISAVFIRATYIVRHFINIGVDGKVYRLHDSLTLEQAEMFMKRAEKMIMKDMCEPDYNQVLGEKKLNRTGSYFTLSRTFSQCVDPKWFKTDDDVPTEFARKFLKVREPLTIVNCDKTLVAPDVIQGSSVVDESDFRPADDLPAIKRRGSLTSGGLLGICAALSIIVRVVVGFVTNNDTEDGIEILVKEELGLPRYDSMLQSTKMVDYRCSETGDVGLKHVE